MSLLDLHIEALTKKPSKNRLVKILGVGGLIGAVALGSTFASNISLNGDQNVEFGQGVATTTACDNSVTLTPTSTFINSSGAGEFLFTSVSVTGISDECFGKTFVIRAYKDGENSPLDLYQTGGSAVYSQVEVSDNSGTFSLENAGLLSDDIATLSDGFSITFSTLGPPESVPLASAEDVDRISIESRSFEDYADWNLVSWNGTTENGPARYANSLTEGKPSWLNEVSTPDLSYRFSSSGMSFSGDADGLGFPYVTSFDVDSAEKISVQFTFFYNIECSDQGVILFPSGTNPIWSWGQNSTGLIAQWNCGEPELGASGLFEYPETNPLQIGNAYKAIFEYDPTLGSNNMSLTTKTLGGETLLQIHLTATLPTGQDYKIGFSGDIDPEEGNARSYFKNLIITVG
jgi:hypothetical protein